MSISNVANVDTFGVWLSITNQTVVAVNQLVSGFANANGTIANLTVAWGTANASFTRANQSFGRVTITGSDSLVANNANLTITITANGSVTMAGNANTDVVTISSPNSFTNFTTSTDTIKANLNSTGQLVAFAVGGGVVITGNANTNTVTVSDQATVAQTAVAFAQANTANTLAGVAYAQANVGIAQTAVAFAQANTANAFALVAYAQANVGIAQTAVSFAQANVGIAQTAVAFAQANTANAFALVAYAQANVGIAQTAVSFARANTSFGVLTTSTDTLTANNAAKTITTAVSGGILITGNANTGTVTFDGTTIFAAANGANITSGGTINGSANITGNLYLSGNTTFGYAMYTKGIAENVVITAASAPANTNLDFQTTAVQYFTANQSSNITVNLRANSTTPLNAALAVGQSFTTALILTNNATAKYVSAYQVDGVGVTPKWSGGSGAPTSGTANSADSYAFTAIKTAANVWTVLATQTGYA